MPESGATGLETRWKTGRRVRARVWQVTAWISFAAAFVLVASVDEDYGSVLVLVIGVLVGAFGFLALRRQHANSRRPEVAGTELFRERGRRHGPVPGNAASSVWLVMDERAMLFMGRGWNTRDVVVPYAEIVDARHVWFTGTRPRRDVLMTTERDGMRMSVDVDDVEGALEILRAHGVLVREPVTIGGFSVTRDTVTRALGVPTVAEPSVSASSPPAERRTPRRGHVRWWAIGALFVLLAGVVAIGLFGERHDDSEDDGPSRAEMAAAHRGAARVMDRWELPHTVVRTEYPDRVTSDDPMVAVVRRFTPAEGVTVEQATQDLVRMLRDADYFFYTDPEEDASGAQGEYRKPHHPDWLLTITAPDGPAQVIEVEFLI